VITIKPTSGSIAALPAATTTVVAVICQLFLFTGYGSDGKAVYLRDIWPSREEIEVSLLL